METADGQQVVVRAALLCAAGGIPAARKTCVVEFPTEAFDTPTLTEQTGRHAPMNSIDQLLRNIVNAIACHKRIKWKERIVFDTLYYWTFPTLMHPRMCIIDSMYIQPVTRNGQTYG